MGLARARQGEAQRLLRARLSDGPRDRDDARLRSRARRAAKVFHGAQGVMHDIQRPQSLEIGGALLGNDSGRGALLEGLRDIVMAIAIVALDRHEQIARLQRARIDRNAIDPGGNATIDARLERRRQREACPQITAHAPNSLSAFRAAS